MLPSGHLLRLQGTAQAHPKETWALITWLVFASYLHARITKAWQGRKPAMIASLGFIVVWICYLGVNFLGKGLHTYGQL